VPYAGSLARSSLTQPHAELAKEFWAVVSLLQIGEMDALELIGHGGQAARALRLSARQRRMVRDLIEIELAMRGLHLPKNWTNQPRRDSRSLDAHHSNSLSQRMARVLAD
jgi:hypothetical protein